MPAEFKRYDKKKLMERIADIGVLLSPGYAWKIEHFEAATKLAIKRCQDLLIDLENDTLP